jgi:type IV pilus assembly protein PilC
MAEFVIKMADERGHTLEQTENGFSEAEVRDRFENQGYLVYSVKPRGLMAGGKVASPFRRRIKLEQFVIFNQQFVTLIRAGLPIVQALDLLARRQRNPYFKSVLTNVRDRAKGGELLSDAFEAQGVFPKIYSTTILAGEKSGHLEEVLTRFLSFQRMGLSFRKKLISSLIYPAVLVVGVLILLTVLITFVVPNFAMLYKEIGVPLPAFTSMILWLGTGVRTWLPLIVLVIAATGVLFWRWSRTDKGAHRLDRIKLAVPALGSIWIKYQIALFSRMLSTLLSGGLPLVPALDTAGASMQSRLMRDGILSSTQAVREGQPLSSSLQETKVFTELSVEMVEVGESTGALPTMLASVAEFYEEDVQTALAAVMSLIEPLILIVMGIIVGGILIALYLPIFSIGAQIH